VRCRRTGGRRPVWICTSGAAKIASVRELDLVIVGGGIAGGALATVMARSGASVLVLERQTRYQDHVRGEILWPWGARLARLLAIERLLLDAGALVVQWLHTYDEGSDGPTRIDVGAVIGGVDGSLNLTHPTACAALAHAAAVAGADVRMGVRDVRISAGTQPFVRWVTDNGEANEARGKLVVGADGRRSSVRSQAAIPFEVDPPAHLIAGMLVNGIDEMDEQINLIARESDLLFFSFPQGAGRARLYFCFPADQRSRFAGRDGAQRFLSTTELRCLKGAAGWRDARPAGPCATFPAEDSRTPLPLAEGVVLIGDAAGYENPLQGQGLSMALQDAHDVSQALLSGSSPAKAFEQYAAARAVRQRLANLSVALEVWANDGFNAQAPEQRASRYEHIERDNVLTALELSFAAGLDTLPQDLAHTELAERLAYSSDSIA
jgi:2-polyprenyl-6-methoxyphenol hydroxylase-like FAD-dependent oxidoreductase